MDLEKGTFRPIPGYPDYEINHIGDVRRLWKSGKTTTITPVQKDRYYIIRLTARSGQRKEERVHKLMQRTFFPPGRPGQKMFYHKNGNGLDNWINNLGYIEKKLLGQKTGGSSRRRAVKKLTPEGEVLEIYKSARYAAKQNFMSYQTVMDYCNGDVKKKKVAPDGFVYRWEERKQT